MTQKKHTSETHGKPEIINTAQFTSEVFSDFVTGQGTKFSMDGKGRAIDNAFIERSWGSAKYEKLYLDPPKDGVGLYLLLVGYVQLLQYQKKTHRHR